MRDCWIMFERAIANKDELMIEVHCCKVHVLPKSLSLNTHNVLSKSYGRKRAVICKGVMANIGNTAAYRHSNNVRVVRKGDWIDSRNIVGNHNIARAIVISGHNLIGDREVSTSATCNHAAGWRVGRIGSLRSKQDRGSKSEERERRYRFGSEIKGRHMCWCFCSHGRSPNQGGLASLPCLPALRAHERTRMSNSNFKAQAMGELGVLSKCKSSRLGPKRPFFTKLHPFCRT